MTRKKFRLLRVIDFGRLVNGYFAERNEEAKLNFELMRKQTTDLINIQLDKNHRIDPRELWPAPWDEPTEKELTEAEIVENNTMLISALEAYTKK